MKKNCLLLLLAIIFTAMAAEGGPQRDVSVRPDLRGRERLTKWDLDGSGSWEISDGKLVLAKPGRPSGPVRRPSALAILKTRPLRRVEVKAQIRSTAPSDVPRRDMVLVFGYESPTRFYYVHLAGVTDAVHNGIFLVADADRRRIDTGKGEPQLKDQAWHRVRLVRDGATGKIEVYVDDSPSPVLSAVDTTIPAGRVGFGSFDDTGEVRGIVINGSIK
jgi:hypothetical protein